MHTDIKKRLSLAFFYAPIILALVLSLTGKAYTASNCDSLNTDLTIRVEEVIDGDTIISTTGEHIRLIGMDTPEIDHTTGRSEPGADLARDYLENILDGTTSLDMVFDIERRDRYGRLLAHLFLPGGANVQAVMLSQGLAVPLNYPPNLKFTDCYHDAADLALDAGKGLWQLPGLQSLSAGELTDKHQGYRIVTGVVKNIIDSKYSLIVNLDQSFSFKILKVDLKYFDTMDISSLLGTLIRVRGEIYIQDGEPQLRIRHPNDIKLLSPDSRSAD